MRKSSNCLLFCFTRLEKTFLENYRVISCKVSDIITTFASTNLKQFTIRIIPL